MNFAIGDIVVLVILLLSALFGLRGLFKSLSGFMGLIVAIVAAVLLCDLVTGFVNDIQFVAGFRTKIENNLIAANADFNQVQGADFYTAEVASQIISYLGIPAVIAYVFSTPISNALKPLATANPTMTVAQVSAEAVVGTIVKVVVVILLIIIIAIVFKMIMKKLNKVCNKHKVTSIINRLLGFAFNLVMGFAVVMVLDYILTLIPLQALVDFRADSVLLTWINDNNLLIALLNHQDLGATFKNIVDTLIPTFSALFAPKA